MTPVDHDPRSRWIVVASLVVGLALTALPLPRLLAYLRPDWLALILIYWCVYSPRYAMLSIVFASGLCLDVLYGTPLGQHSLALLVCCYFPRRFHLQMRVFSWLQLLATVTLLLAVYHFALFWINGVIGLTTYLVDYWAPVVTGTLFWPVIILLLDGVRLHRSTTG